MHKLQIFSSCPPCRKSRLIVIKFLNAKTLPTIKRGYRLSGQSVHRQPAYTDHSRPHDGHSSALTKRANWLGFPALPRAVLICWNDSSFQLFAAAISAAKFDSEKNIFPPCRKSRLISDSSHSRTVDVIIPVTSHHTSTHMCYLIFFDNFFLIVFFRYKLNIVQFLIVLCNNRGNAMTKLACQFANSSLRS